MTKFVKQELIFHANHRFVCSSFIFLLLLSFFKNKIKSKVLYILMKFLINQCLYIKNLLLTHFTLTNKGYKYILTFLNIKLEDTYQNIFKVTGYRVDRWCLFLGCDGEDSFSYVRFQCKVGLDPKLDNSMKSLQ